MTSTSSRSKPISTSRFTLMGLPVHAMVARNTNSRTVNSGVNSLVSTGAMFSMTLCFASTSQDPMMTAPIAPHGISQPATNHPAFIAMALNIIIVKPVRTPPPSANPNSGVDCWKQIGGGQPRGSGNRHLWRENQS